MDLGGIWQAAPADEALRRSFHLPDFDDDGWEPVPVPGHWQDVPAFHDHDDSLLYRSSFDHPHALADGMRSWLELDGLFAQGDVWLDGEYLGDTEGYFVRHAFDITDALVSGNEHVLACEVNCRTSGRDGKRRALLGVFEGGNDIITGGNPGGIWAPVRIRTTGPVRIDTLRAICIHADEQEAVVAIRAGLSSSSARTVQVITELAGNQLREEKMLAVGANEVEWRITVPRPDRWWPSRLGPQTLHQLRVAVETRTDEVSDEHLLDIGLRSVSMRRWQFTVNGEPLHVKGVNLAPTDRHLAAATPERIEADLQLAADAGFDLVRPYAHVAPPSLYAAADRMGLLVWQDLPLLGSAANSLRREAVREAQVMVNQLGHHACIASWNAHVSPATEWMQPDSASARTLARRAASHQLPTWTKSVLDRSIKRAFESADGSRPTTGFTGVLPHLPRLESSASHLWFGWRRGRERDLADYAATFPSQVRFVAEFGAASVPNGASFASPERWPYLDWEDLEDHFGYEAASFSRYVPPAGHPTFGSWVDASQRYQAGLLRRQIETLRRLAGRPNGGFCVQFLADCEPRISAALVEHDRTVKPAYEAVKAACAPVIVVADRLPARVTPGQPIALDVHVVSDEREELVDAEIEAEITWRGDRHRWRFTGTVEPAGVSRVGTLSWVVPDAPGLATLSLSLSGPASANNRYDTTIT